MMHLVLKVDIKGDVDQPGLERLRSHLDLKKQGRLTDDWDEAFGKRVARYPDGQQTKIALYRDANDGFWSINVSTTEPIPNEAGLTALGAELVGGINAAGFQATVRAKPSYGPPKSP